MSLRHHTRPPAHRQRLRRLLAPLLLLAWIAPTGPTHGQEIMRIAAVVNDEVISFYDLISRTRLVLLSSGLSDTPEMRQRLVPQVLRSLIDERLQLQEAARINISVPQTKIDDALAGIERSNNIPAGELGPYLAQAGVDLQTIVQQVRASISWGRILERESRRDIVISDEEVDEVIAALEANRGRPQSLVSEIFLAVDSVDQERDVEGVARGLVEQLRSGAKFEALAQQFSQSATAAVGGDIGWMQEGQLPAELEKALAEMRPGQISDPIRTITGFHILNLRERQVLEVPTSEDVVVTLDNIYFQLPANATEEDTRSAHDLAAIISETVTDCEDMRRLRGESGATPFSLPNQIKIGDLNEQIRAIVGPLDEGEASEPIDIGAGVMVLMVCERSEPPGLANREKIRTSLGTQRLDVLARRMMRDLRRAAFVDLRL